MTGRLILIAHAETDATRRGSFPAGEPLNARGLEAARALAGALRDAEALCSPALAARQTADALDLKAAIEPNLDDLAVGRWAGRSIMDIGTDDPESASAWIEDPGFAGHGGESFELLIARIGDWLASRLGLSGRLIGITHAAVLRAAAIATLGAPSAAFWRIEAPPLAQLTLGSDGRRWVLRELRQS